MKRDYQKMFNDLPQAERAVLRTVIRMLHEDYIERPLSEQDPCKRVLWKTFEACKELEWFFPYD